MPDVDWVTLRSACSIGLLFEQLKAQIKKDVDTREAQVLSRGAPFLYAFKFKVENDTIIALAEGHRLHESITFRLLGNAIEVMGRDGKLLLSGTATLNNDGDCRLRVNGDELELWQFRKKALEDLFFIVPADYMSAEERRIYPA